VDLWVLKVSQLLETRCKSLIFQYFELDPSNLWITLLKTRSGCAGSLENQGFQQIAYPICKMESLMKSMTYSLGAGRGLLLRSKPVLPERLFTFVHKSSAQSQIFCK
jgi:hypothetical protein